MLNMSNSIIANIIYIFYIKAVSFFMILVIDQEGWQDTLCEGIIWVSFQR